MSINNNEKNSENPQEKNIDYEVLMKQKLKEVIDGKLDNIEKNGNYPEDIDEICKIIEQNDYKNIQTEVSQHFVKKIEKEKISELDTNNFLKKNLPEELKLRLEKFFLSYQDSLSEAKTKYKKWFENPNIDEKILEENLKKISFEDLKNMTFSVSKMKKIFEKYNFEKNFYEIEEQKIKKLFDELNLDETKLQKMTEEENEEYEKWIKFFERYWSVEKEFFAKILELSENNSEKQKLIAYFNPTISYNEIIDLKILDENGKTELEKKLFDQAISGFNQEKLVLNSPFSLKNDKRFDSEEYKNFVNNLISENPKISIDQIDKDGKLMQNQDFLQKIIEEIQQKSQEIKNLEDEQNVRIENLEEFKKILKDDITQIWKEKFFEGIDNIAKWNYITIDEKIGQKSFWKIKEVDSVALWTKKWIILEKMKVWVNSEINQTFWENSEKPEYFFYSYDELNENFVNKIDNENHIKVTKDEPDLPNFDESIRLSTIEEFTEYIDEMDPDNKNVKIENGMSFSVVVDWKPEIGTIKYIDEANKKVEIQMYDGQEAVYSWLDFLQILSENECNIRRIGKIDNPEDFAKNIKITEVSSTESKLTQVDWIEYNSDTRTIETPDRYDANKKYKVAAFTNSGWNEFYEVEFHGNEVELNVVSYGKITKEEIEKEGLKTDEELKKMSKKWWKHEEKAKAYKIERDRTRKKITKYWKISYQYFLQIIQKNKAIIPISEDQKKTQIEEYEEEIANREWNNMDGSNKKSRITWMNVRTVSKIIEWNVEFYKEKFKHKQEVREASAFLKMGGHMGRIGITKMTKLIDWEMSVIKSKYMGKDRRQYIEKEILNNPKAKPYEVMAGAMLVLEMAGHFYPDSFLSNQQDRDYKWFVKIAEALELNPRTEYKRCYDKCAGEKPEFAHRPPEEDMVERLFKFYQDNPMVQSIGGGAKFWNLAPAGRSAQAEKWAKEVTYNSTAKGRSDYILAKMKSNEFEIALGAMPVLLDTDTSPEFMGPIFAMAAGNAPNYVHNETLDKIRKIVFKGVPFHGFTFARHKENSDLYKDIIKIACQKYDEANWTSLLKSYQNACRSPKEWPDYTKSQYVHNEEQYDELAKFWADNYKVLHPLLQGVNPTLQIALEDNKTSPEDKNKIRKYLEIMHWTAQYLLEEWWLNKLGSHNSSMGTLRPKSSWHFMKSREGEEYRSLVMELSSMTIKEIDKSMSWPDRENIFNGQILEFFKIIRDNPTYNQNPEYQKKQFKISFLELMNKLIEKTFPISEERFNESLASGKLKHFTMLVPLFGKKILSYNFLNKKDIEEWNRFTPEVIDEFYNYFINSSSNSGKTEFIKNSVSKNVNFTLTWDSANDNLHKITT